MTHQTETATDKAGLPGRLPNDRLVELPSAYVGACTLAISGRHSDARLHFERLALESLSPRVVGLIRNDLAVLAAVEGRMVESHTMFQALLAEDSCCKAAAANMATLAAHIDGESDSELTPIHGGDSSSRAPVAHRSATRIAVLSLLFNWPSTGGGNIHTVELVRFLTQAGYHVRHFYARYPEWHIGNVSSTLRESEGLGFDKGEWNVKTIQHRFRKGVDAFAPDFILITDSWNMKPHLAEAMRGYPIFLRFQALECLCPLNNLRLLTSVNGSAEQCSLDQLRNPLQCFRCLQHRAHQSGPLHRAERDLAGIGTLSYQDTLTRALNDAEGVLVLNPAIAALFRPHTTRVQVVTWGMDPARFPGDAAHPPPSRPRKVIFQAGIVDEFMKGFHVLHGACSRLWKKRRDFELIATGDPAGRLDEFTRFVGWQTQDTLPVLYSQADIVVVPTVAQEGLSRTSVEAMAAGRPVVGSDIGGVPFTVTHGATGLLFVPGDADGLARNLETLLDDDGMRRRFGEEGRRQFERRFAWPTVIERDYRPLFIARSAK